MPSPPVQDPDAVQKVGDLIDGFWAVQVLNAAATLKLPEALADGPSTAEALAPRLGARAPSLARLLRAMEAFGLCRVSGAGAYALTAAGELLRADAPGSMRGRAMFSGSMLWAQFGDLTHVVRTGEAAPSVAAGREGFDALQQDPATLAAFQQAMAESSIQAAAEAMKAYDFRAHCRILDLGGGYGGVLATLLKAYPELSGDVCDLAYLADGARGYLDRAGVGGRAGFIAGDFSASAPEGYDLYLLKFIIHDWDDAHARAILANCARAAGPTAKVALLEQVVPETIDEGRVTRSILRSDLTMMTVGGKERMVEEYRRLLDDAGLEMTAVHRAGPSFSLIEAVPRR